jgi:hypothetical protein
VWVERFDMKIVDIISVIGSFASVGAAIWAYVEARKSINAASKAEEFKNEIIYLRKTVEVSQVYAETKRLLNVVSKVGPSFNPSVFAGINCADIAKEVEIFSSFILEQSEHFSQNFNNKAKELNSDLKSDIENLSEAITFEDTKKYGKSIYYKIQTFIPIVKKLSDEKREQI